MDGLRFLIITHNLAVVRHVTDRVAVLYQGRLCEIGPAASVYAQPLHPYTRVLLGAVLEPDPDHVPQLLADDVLESAPPTQGCPFQRRCPVHQGARCDGETPPWQDAGQGHQVRCHIPLAQLSQALALSTEARHVG